ncbi:MAG: DEAD/DEAH box helicase [Gammaproteobacteria bacterium]
MSEVITGNSAAWGRYPENKPVRPAWGEAGLQRLLGSLSATGNDARAQRFLTRVNDKGAALSAASADELLAKLAELRRALRATRLDDASLVEIFALIRELADRTLGQRHYDCQVIGGWALMQGMAAEMDTGEGKTLTASLPAATAALAGMPVHVITVNDYLAERDAASLAPLYKIMGLSVGLVTEEIREPADRRAAYRCDITYTTNNQLAFDYLRDRIVMGQRRDPLHRLIDRARAEGEDDPRLLLRGLHFAIVDEADSVLIDEARTPLKLSGPSEDGIPAEICQEALALAAKLSRHAGSYQVIADRKMVKLTAVGRRLLGQLARSAAPVWRQARHREKLLEKALCALHCYQCDQDYLVRDSCVAIIDEHTGRAMPDRQWESGLHQLIEAKENCEITAGTRSLAQINFQRFFTRYLHLAAMTGTAREVAGELREVYGLSTLRVPRRQALRRIALPTRMHLSQEEKWQDIVREARRLHAEGRPLLIGTRSVADSETLSRYLGSNGLPHQVLNAREDQKEAELIGRAGQPGRIIVATNMAGRGTDIHLAPGVAEKGGLHVIITERNEARRIDRQLYGRCARQGDPGSYQAILSFEDQILQICAPRPIIKFISALDSRRLPVISWLGRALTRLAQLGLEWKYARIRRAMAKSEDRLGDALAFSGQPD